MLSTRARRLGQPATAIVGVAVAVAIGFAAGRATPGTSAPSVTQSAAAPAADPDLIAVPANATPRGGFRPEMVRVAKLPAAISTTGVIEADRTRTRTLTALTAGRVEAVNVDVGEHVAAGAVVASIVSSDVAELEGRLDEALARRDVAAREVARVRTAENRSAIVIAKAKLAEAEQTLARTRTLAAAGIAPRKDVTAAETGVTSARADYDFQRTVSLDREVGRADGELREAGAEVQHLRGSLGVLGAEHGELHAGPDDGRILLHSPIDGTVVERNANAGVGIESGKALVTISDPRAVWVTANVSSAQLASVAPGDAASVTTRDGSRLAGRVAFVDPALDPQTHSGRVRIDVRDPAARLRVADFVTVKITAGAANESRLTVPTDALARDGTRTLVFVAQGSDRYRARTVEAGDETAGRVEIRSGLRPGERIATSGVFALKTMLLKSSLGEGD